MTAIYKNARLTLGIIPVSPVGFEPTYFRLKDGWLAVSLYGPVPKRRFELLRPCGHQVLSLAWLPLHHIGMSRSSREQMG